MNSGTWRMLASRSASRGVDSSPGRQEGRVERVECFLRDADACKKFHDSIFIAVPLVVAVALRQASAMCIKTWRLKCCPGGVVST